MPKRQPKPMHGGKRAGAGRPRKYDSSTRVTVVLPSPLLAKADEFAAKNGLSRSEAMAKAIEALPG